MLINIIGYAIDIDWIEKFNIIVQWNISYIE